MFLNHLNFKNKEKLIGVILMDINKLAKGIGNIPLQMLSVSASTLEEALKQGADNLKTSINLDYEVVQRGKRLFWFRQTRFYHPCLENGRT